MDEEKGHDDLVEILHLDGLGCPEGKTPVEQSQAHRRDRGGVFSPRLRAALQRLGRDALARHPSPRVIVRILQGFARGVPTLRLARERGIERKHLRERRHPIQALAAQACRRDRLADPRSWEWMKCTKMPVRRVSYTPIPRTRRAAAPIKRGVLGGGRATVLRSWGSVAGKAARSNGS